MEGYTLNQKDVTSSHHVAKSLEDFRNTLPRDCLACTSQLLISYQSVKFYDGCRLIHIVLYTVINKTYKTMKIMYDMEGLELVNAQTQTERSSLY